MKTETDGDKSNKSLLSMAKSKRTQEIQTVSRREDSIQNLHLFLENRAAKLALDRHENVCRAVDFVFFVF